MLCKKTVVESIKIDLFYLDFWSSYRLELEKILYQTESKQFKNQELKNFENEKIENLLTIFKNFLTTQEKDLWQLWQEFLTQENFQEFLKDEKLKTFLEFKLKENQQFLLDIHKKLTHSPQESQKIYLEITNNLALALDKYLSTIIKENILLWDRRLDLRPLDKTRQISCQINVLPRTHGSSLFQRGETQVLNILTLGTKEDAQILDDMEDFQESTKRYIHHYNFPAYSVGEIGKYNGPGRREIGHGALAEKALIPVLPDEESFPYTIRLVSECLGSNGSTSMASTCASTLSLMAGGVPIKDMVAGVAMGLVLDTESVENLEQELQELQTIRKIMQNKD